MGAKGGFGRVDSYKKTLITGGSGMVGSAFKRILPNAEYPTRQEMDLSQGASFEGVDGVIHLAARVGGIKANMDFVGDFYIDNMRINHNVINQAKKDGVRKVVSLLSTCVYPDAAYIKYPLTEEQLHIGPPHDSNFGYAYAKRMVDVISRAYRQQYGCNFITAIPNNLYGEHDNFDLINGHVIPALMRRIWEAKINDVSSVECWGDGSPLREFTYSEDVAHILLFLMKHFDGAEPINIGNTEEYSIQEVVKLICEYLEYDGKIIWNTDKPSGQYRKPSSNRKLLELGWREENYTPFKEGLKKTCKWFKINYPNVRGVV